MTEPPSFRRSIRFNLLLTAPERRELEDAARREGLTLAAFMRRAALREARRVRR